MAVADAVLWSLGEIGSPAALEKLHGMLSDLICANEVIETMGKIGHTTSVIRLLPLLIEGTTEQRELCAQAILRIARNNGGDLGDDALHTGTMEAIEKTIEKDKSLKARWYAVCAYSVLGGHLPATLIKKAIGAKLSDGEMDSVNRFFADDKTGGGEPKKKGRKLV